MNRTRALVGCGAVAVSVLLGVAWTHGGQDAADAPPIDADDLAGVVTGPNGPEAGVWVIAETSDLPTTFARIVGARS